MPESFRDTILYHFDGIYEQDWEEGMSLTCLRTKLMMDLCTVALKQTGGNIALAAKLLNLNRTTLSEMLARFKKLGLKEPKFARGRRKRHPLNFREKEDIRAAIEKAL